jgi:hypothetical protein
MVEKLLLDDTQIEMIQGLMDEHRQAQRENFAASRDVFRAAMGNNPNAGQNGGNAGNGGNGAQRKNRPRFDPEAFRKAMENPEVKSKMDEVRAEGERIDNQFAAAVSKLLTPRQRSNYRKMLGAPFDRSKLGGPPWAQPGRNAPNAGTAKTANPATKAAPPASASSGQQDEGDSTTAKPAPAAATDEQSPRARPKRKSLRELRGIGKSKPDES